MRERSTHAHAHAHTNTHCRRILVIGTLCVTVLASLRLTQHRLHSQLQPGPAGGARHCAATAQILPQQKQARSSRRRPETDTAPEPAAPEGATESSLRGLAGADAGGRAGWRGTRAATVTRGGRREVHKYALPQDLGDRLTVRHRVGVSQADRAAEPQVRRDPPPRVLRAVRGARGPGRHRGGGRGGGLWKARSGGREPSERLRHFHF